jgi:enolase-phosphatase E1
MLGSHLPPSKNTYKISRLLDFGFKPSIILLDIEGTTTPVDFVYGTLFPYANRMLEYFFRRHYNEPEIKLLIQDLQKQHKTDENQGLQTSVWMDETEESQLYSGIRYCRWLMANDRKLTPLKTLQGMIWNEGYSKGELQGQVYPDVPSAFNRWIRQKREICIYSSGSILAQQLLFRTIPSGDLTSYIAAYYDTSIGGKTETKSYKNIAELRSRNSNDFLFISDTMKEIAAAREAGMQAILCNRDKRISELPESKLVIHSFGEIFPD